MKSFRNFITENRNLALQISDVIYRFTSGLLFGDDRVQCHESVKKVKEEIGELIEAVEQDTNKIHEAADVIYHLMVYLEANNIKIEDVMNELKKRQK